MIVFNPFFFRIGGPCEVAQQFSDTWREKTSGAYRTREHSFSASSAPTNYQIYRLYPSSLCFSGSSFPPGSMRKATLADAALVANWYAAFSEEVHTTNDVLSASSPSLSTDEPPRFRETTSRKKKKDESVIVPQYMQRIARMSNAVVFAVNSSIATDKVYLWVDETQVIHSLALIQRDGDSVALTMIYTPRPFRRQGFASALIHSLASLLSNECSFLYVVKDSLVPETSYR